MRVHIAADHAGFELKAKVVDHLSDAGHDVTDHGAHSYDPDDDYPSFCIAAGEAVVADEGSLGIVIGGSGNGEQIAANKVRGVRAALVWSEEIAALARAHNDANVASLGGRMHAVEDSLHFVDVFLSTEFSHEDRHQRRIDLLAAYERDR